MVKKISAETAVNTYAMKGKNNILKYYMVRMYSILSSVRAYACCTSANAYMCARCANVIYLQPISPRSAVKGR